MYKGLLHLHSGFRYLVLLLLIITIVKAISGIKSNGEVKNYKMELYTMVSFHIQVLLGIVLYFISPAVETALSDFGAAMKFSEMRFIAIEHPLVMLIAAFLITIGYSKAKPKTMVKGFSKTILIYYGIALILVLSRIPSDSWFFSSN